MPSFEITSKPNTHEIENSLSQANKEIKQRFDFKNSDTYIERDEKGFIIHAGSKEKTNSALDVLIEKFVKRKISLKFISPKEATQFGNKNWRMNIELKKGIDKDNSKKIVQEIKKNKNFKVSTAINEDTIRVTGKSKDDLQTAIQFIRSLDLSVHVDFENFKD